MATLYLDNRQPDDTGDGNSPATAKKTVQGIINHPNWNQSNTIQVYPGVYKSSEGVMFSPFTSGFNITWNAVFPGTVYVLADDRTTYRNATVRAYSTYNGIVFRDIPRVFSSDNAGSSQFHSLRFTNCRFMSCGTIWSERTGSNADDQNAIFNQCIFSKCGVPGVPIITLGDDTIHAMTFTRNVFYKCDTGNNSLIKMDANINENGLSIFNNIFHSCVANRIWQFNQSADSLTHFANVLYNDYFNNTLAFGFVLTTTQEHADLASWQANTLGGVGSREDDPGLIDPENEIFLTTPGGNSDRTGMGTSVLGLGLGFGLSDTSPASGIWQGATVSPGGEATYTGGRWVHNNTPDTIVTITTPIFSLGESKVITSAYVSSVQDTIFGVVDEDLTDQAQTFEAIYGATAGAVSSGTFAPLPMASGFNQVAEYGQYRITLRNDG